jgi:hypothetical protein
VVIFLLSPFQPKAKQNEEAGKKAQTSPFSPMVNRTFVNFFKNLKGFFTA